MDRDEFMELVYETFETFADEPDNVLANGIIEAADAYAEHEKAQLFKEGATKDTISRQAALEKVRAMQAYKLFEDIILVDKAEVQTELMMLPSVQPDPHEGHWIWVAGDLECSECHTRYPDLYPDYDNSVACPHCGAHMKGERQK